MIQLTPEQLKTLGMEDMATSELEALTQQIGKSIFSNALTEMLDTLNEMELAAFNTVVDAAEDLDQVVTHIAQTYPHFETLLKKHEQTFVQSCLEEMHKTA